MVLRSSSLECDPICRLGLHRVNQVKLRLLGWVLIQYNWYPYKRGTFGHSATQREKRMLRDIGRRQTKEVGGRLWCPGDTDFGGIYFGEHILP